MSNEKQSSVLRTLFTSTFFISMFTFGGGYVIVPLMKKRFTDELGWIDEDEMLNLVSIGQSAPGPVAVNTSIILGFRMAGIKGALVTTLGTIIPPLLIMTILTYVYLWVRDNPYVNNAMLGMQAGIAAIILSVVIDMGERIIKSKDPIHIAVMIFSLIAAIVLGVNVIWLLAFAAIVGIIYTYYQLHQNHGGGA